MSPFDPTTHIIKLKGKDYLEVKWRLGWLRDEHPDSIIETEIVQVDNEVGFCLAKARIVIPGGGESTDYGSETRKDFGDFIEKSITKAIGRALGSLGYGTQFCEDFDTVDATGTVHIVDSPVEKATPAQSAEKQPQAGTPIQLNADPVTPAQMKALAAICTKPGASEIESAFLGKEKTTREHLSKKQASALIETLNNALKKAA